MKQPTGRSCESCRHYLAPGAVAPVGGNYGVPCCVHPRLVNPHGVIAISIARAPGALCGQEAAFWTVAPGRG